MASGTYKLFKPQTDKQRRNHFKHILMTPASNGRHVLGESAVIDWLHGVDAPDAVLRIMALCGDKAEQARRQLIALNQFFKWLLSLSEPEAAEVRGALRINVKTARNPCAGLQPPERKRGKDGAYRSGHQYLTNDQIEEWKDACKDDPEQHRAIRFLQICGPRISDLHRFHRGMLKMTPAGLVLKYRPTKGDGSAFRDGPNPEAIIPVVPELQALIDEVPADRFTFIHSEFDRPFQSAASFGNKVRKWRRGCGLPEGLSAHGMRKSATHWWLRNHRDLIPNTFALKTIFGWVTDKELNRYTRDFDREAEADGMLIKLSERRKAS
jgi:integrase